MEMLLYIFGNWCAILAGCILLWHYFYKGAGSAKNGAFYTKELYDVASGEAREGLGSGELDSPSDMGFAAINTQGAGGKKKVKDILVSRDLQIMICIGTFLRVYWSCSPPPVWDEEALIIQYLSIADVFISPILWSAIVFFVGFGTQAHLHGRKKFSEEHRSSPVWCSWPALTVMAALCGCFGAKFLPPMDGPNSWPYADHIIMFNMCLDGFAMVPQMHLIAHSTERASSEASHFVGLLCLARVFRMMFWFILFAAQILMASANDTHGNYLWTFIVPDVVHTLIMGDYLRLWLHKVKKDNQSLIDNTKRLVMQTAGYGPYGSFGSMHV